VAKGILPYHGLGSGIMRVMELCPNVKFVDDREGVQFKAIVPREVLVNEPNPEPNPEPNEPNLDRMLKMLRHDASLTIPEMARSMDVSRETVKRMLVKLKNAGLLVREGGTRGHWRVIAV